MEDGVGCATAARPTGGGAARICVCTVRRMHMRMHSPGLDAACVGRETACRFWCALMLRCNCLPVLQGSAWQPLCSFVERQGTARLTISTPDNQEQHACSVHETPAAFRCHADAHHILSCNPAGHDTPAAQRPLVPARSRLMRRRPARILFGIQTRYDVWLLDCLGGGVGPGHAAAPARDQRPGAARAE